MCYMVHISTDCTDDLSCRTSDLVRFASPSDKTYTPCPRILKHDRKWFVGSKSGCSCTFRHLGGESVRLGFGAPEDWFPEEQDGIDATHQLYVILKEMVQRGHQVDLFDGWCGNEDNLEAVQLDVALSKVPMDHFRLFEDHVFNLKP